MNLDKYRNQYPTFTYKVENQTIDAMIPFSSEIKFNMYIRNMNEKILNPAHADDNLMVVMKGAPERILSRCSKILINGEERDFDDEARE